MNTWTRGFLIFPAVAASAVLNACKIYHFTDAPPLTGEVVNQVTNRPVAGAFVSMTSDHATVQTRTDRNGKFDLPAIRHWGIVTNRDVFFPCGTLEIRASGYHLLVQKGLGSVGLEQVGPDEDSGSVEGVGVGPDLEHIHVALAPKA